MLFTAALANYSQEIESGELQVSCEDLPELPCDANQMIFLFQHLIENAWKFRRENPASVQIGCSERDDAHVFFVRDKGIGFDSRHNEQVFRMFKRLEGDRFPGTGVGLAICRQIVVRHNGGIWAESAPDQGTTIWFTLPKA
jgi:light-regulated signal transduction histidine kinase (bacteriophytochrome)